jgi:hypothetical protein
MTSVTQLESMLKHLLNQRANELARTTGFVKRERKLTGADFVQIMTFGHLHQPHASLAQLTQVAQLRQVHISSAGLHQRCTQRAATFLQAMLGEVVEQVVRGAAVPIALFKRFEQVILQDSSTILLPAALAETWPGCAGGSQEGSERTQAALKLHVRLDLKHGQLIGPHLSAGRVHELQGPLRALAVAAGSLYLADRSYWSLSRLRELDGQGVFFCLHPKSQTVYYDQQGKRIDLQAVLPRTVGQVKVLHVLLGKQQPLAARLLIVRVPQAVAQQRQAHLSSEAARKGQVVSPLSWELAHWTLIVTNTSAKQLSVEQALIVLRARWAIELLFKLWKSHAQIDQWRTAHPWRVLCELYGKLLAVVLQHWFLLLGCWQDPWRSLVKASAVVRSLALDLLHVLCGTRRLPQVVHTLRRLMQAGCQVNRRATEPCLAQLFLDGLDWLLT